MSSAKLGVILYKKNRLRVLENRVLSRIFGQNEGPNEELHDLYSSLHIIMVGHLTRVWEMRIVYIILLGKHECNTPFGRPRRR
jgi:hypothetical protein